MLWTFTLLHCSSKIQCPNNLSNKHIHPITQTHAQSLNQKIKSEKPVQKDLRRLTSLHPHAACTGHEAIIMQSSRTSTTPTLLKTVLLLILMMIKCIYNIHIYLNKAILILELIYQHCYSTINCNAMRYNKHN